MIVEILIKILTMIGAITVFCVAYAMISDATEEFRKSRKRKCPNCGAKYKFLDSFCRSCGTRLHDGKYPTFINDSKPAEPTELGGKA